MKYYKFSCAVMAVVTFVMTIVTAIYATSGANLYQTPLTAVLLVIFALITVVCLCISTVKGRLLYKIGFYVLHIGIVVAIIGFMVYGITGKKYDVNVLCDGTYYSAINDMSESSDGEIVELDFYFRLDDTYSEYYLDDDGNETKNPKHYIAYLTVIQDDGEPETIELTVNDPVHIKGYKIYLMGMIDNIGMEGATLLFKYNPAEYTILAGLVLIIAGTFIMCLFGDINIKLKAKAKKAEELTERSDAK